ncbi:MAG TPA: hypothetical protein ENI61_06640 [Ignavibacteria bacterium]|nr:hypothetical protein [Ignavibacteria bacterium]
MGLRVIIKGDQQIFDDIEKDIEFMNANMKAQVKAIGPEAAVKMRSIIADGKIRPQSGEPTKLENNINVEYSNDGWGVGDIEGLKKNAPHWAAINWGSDHLVGTEVYGQFSPGEAKPNPKAYGQGRLKKGPYKVKIEKPIEPKNYIEKTITFVRNQINNIRLGK